MESWLAKSTAIYWLLLSLVFDLVQFLTTWLYFMMRLGMKREREKTQPNFICAVQFISIIQKTVLLEIIWPSWLPFNLLFSDRSGLSKCLNRNIYLDCVYFIDMIWLLSNSDHFSSNIDQINLSICRHGPLISGKRWIIMLTQ